MKDIYPGLSQKHAFLIIEGFLPRNFGTTFGLLLKQRIIFRIEYENKYNEENNAYSYLAWVGDNLENCS